MRSALVADCMLPDKGLCHALLGSAAHLDLVSGNCILSELSIFELDAMLVRKTRNDSCSESSLLCRSGQLGGQALPPCLRFWSYRNGRGKILILSPWNEFLAIFLGGNKQGMASLWTLGNYLHIWVGKECWLTKRKWLWETSPLEQLELSQFQLWTMGQAPDTLFQPWTPVFLLPISPELCKQLPLT